MALTKIGATLGGSADVIQVTQSSHGLSLGFPVKVSGNGTYAHASADSATNAEAIGIIIATTTDTMTIALGGRITIDGVLPSGNIAAGTVLFLHTSAGKLTATEPSGNNEVSKPMAVITYLNSEMIMVQQRGEVISTTGITLADGSVDNDAMADDAINTDELVADAVTNAKLANMATRTVKANATSGSANPTDVVMADGDFLIANASALVTVPITGDVVISNAGAATIQTDAVDIGMLSASGSASSSTFLRGDNEWAAATTAFIGCRAYTTAVQSIPHNAQTNVNFAGEDFKAGVTHSTSSDPDEFTIVTAGYYQMNFFGRLGGAGDFILVAAWIARQPDGSGITNIASDQAGGPSDNAINDPSFHVSCIYNLSVDDVIRFRINHYNSGNTARNTVVGTGYSTIAEIWKIG